MTPESAPPLPTPAKRSTGKVVGVVIGVLLLGCCGLFAISMLSGVAISMMSRSDDPGPRADAPAAEVATDADLEDSTEAPAVDTEEATEAPADTAAVCDYLTWTGTIVPLAGFALIEFDQVLTEAGQTPSRMLDVDWRIRAAAALGSLNTTAKAIRERDQADIPDEALALHVQLGQFATTLETITTNFAVGTGEVSADKIAIAKAAMAEFPGLTKAMKAELTPLLAMCSSQ